MEAQEQHRRLREQAANVIANQKQTEMRLNRAHGRAREGQRQRPPGRAHGRRSHQGGDADEDDRVHARPPKSFANRLIALESEVESLKTLHLQVGAGGRSGQGRGAAELGRAAAEALRASEAPRSARPGEDAGADEQGDGVAVRDRRRRRADARRGARRRSRPATPRPRACPSSPSTSVESRMLEVEQASMNRQAQTASRRDPRAARHRAGA